MLQKVNSERIMRKYYFSALIIILSAINANCDYWKYNNDFIGNEYFKIAVKDTNSFYVIGQSKIRSRCEYTTDIGETWSNILPDSLVMANPNNNMTKIEAKTIFYFKETDCEVILIGCAGDTILRTTDNGQTWTTIFLHNESKEIKEIRRVNKNLYYCFTEYSLFCSSDYGLTWKKILIPVNKNLGEKITFPYLLDESFWLINFQKYFQISPKYATYRQITYKSSDKGENWEEYIIETHPNYRNLACRIFRIGTSDTLYAYVNVRDTTNDDGDTTNFYKSYDFGKSWNFINSPFLLRVSTFIGFKDSKSGYVGNDYKKIIHTSDGGLSWSYDSLQYSIPKVSDIAFLNEHKSILLAQYKLFINDDRYTSIEESKQGNILLYPNPLPKSVPLNINFSKLDNYSKCSIKIIDVTGKIVDEFTTNNIRADINLQYLPDPDTPGGTYFLVIESDEGIIAKEKFVVE
jgi:photosystem II stability/assembly factor-like uncharacterized protein